MGSPYDDLFERYVVELRAARDVALAWWEALLVSVGADVESVQQRWPCGPTSHPRVIGVYRKYYLECEEFTERLRSESASTARAGWGESDAAGLVEYQVAARFLLDSLEPVEPKLAEFMQLLVFSPIGIDVNGQVV